MKKIPTLFERDWNGDRSRVLPQVHEGCEWVLAGEGTPTRKLDGSCCMIRDGKLFKRQEFKKGQPTPDDFEEVNFDDETGKRIGWRPVGDSAEDKWHREAFVNLAEKVDGTYELVGPKTQGNPEKFDEQRLVPHTVERLRIEGAVPRDFDGLRAYLADKDWEGIVFHQPDGRMAKIKKRDFGLKRASATNWSSRAGSDGPETDEAVIHTGARVATLQGPVHESLKRAARTPRAAPMSTRP